MPLVVTGMPRSGTSLLCAILAELGYEFGCTLGADKYAPTGYFERLGVVAFNHRVVHALGGENILPGRRDILTHPNYPTWLEEARNLLNAAAAIKVPRAALLHPLWLDAGEARWIVSVRHPVAVGKSWRSVYSFNGEEYWDRYYSVLADIPGAIFVHYDRWFVDAEAELDRLCGKLGVPVNYAALERIGSEHRHYHARGSDSALYLRLLGLCSQ